MVSDSNEFWNLEKVSLKPGFRIDIINSDFWLAGQSIQNPNEAKSPIDPSTEQNGYLLISHMIAKYNLPRNLILTCFEKLLKSYTLEVKLIVNEGWVHLSTSLQFVEPRNQEPDQDNQNLEIWRSVDPCVEPCFELHFVFFKPDKSYWYLSYEDSWYFDQWKYRCIRRRAKYASFLHS